MYGYPWLQDERVEVNVFLPPTTEGRQSGCSFSRILPALLLAFLFICAGTGVAGLATLKLLPVVPAIAREQSTPVPGSSDNADQARQTVVQFAEQQIGKKYVWGGNGPDVWDCSGLVKAAYASVGIVIPRTCTDQWNAIPKMVPGARILDPNEPKKPADLVFFTKDGGKSSDHIGLYDGRSQTSFIEATPPKVTRSDFALQDDQGGIKGRADMAGVRLLGYIRVIPDDYQGNSGGAQPPEEQPQQPPQPPPSSGG